MSRAHFEAVRKRTREASQEAGRNRPRTMDAEGIRQEALANRTSKAGAPADMSLAAEARQSLFAKMGYDFMHVDDLTPHPENSYSMNEEEIEELSELLYESGNTQPLVVRIEPNTRTNQILAGERRWRAHKLLAKKHGDSWSMVPVRNLGIISDEKALFMLDSDNLGARNITASERARGAMRMAKYIEARRKNDPEYRAKHKGKKTRDIIAEKTGLSKTTVASDLQIEKGLIDEGKDLLDREAIKVKQAQAMTRLSGDAQREIVEKIKSENCSSEQIDEMISEATSKQTGKPRKPTKEKTTNSLMSNACHSLKKAMNSAEDPDPKLVAQLKKYILELDERVNKRLSC